VEPLSHAAPLSRDDRRLPGFMTQGATQNSNGVAGCRVTILMHTSHAEVRDGQHASRQ
jgi:hypothetical protein